MLPTGGISSNSIWIFGPLFYHSAIEFCGCEKDV